MEGKYRVDFYQDNIYKVVEVNKEIKGDSWDGWDDHYKDVTVFKGTLADCEAWLRLNEKGYIKTN